MDRKTQVNQWEKIIGYRRGMEVDRWHTRQTVFSETVGHHSANVALLCDIISEGACSRDVLYTALVHDVGEFWTGDTPAPAKAHDPGIAASIQAADARYLGSIGVTIPLLSAAEVTLIKAADILDLLWFARLELQVGNSDFEEVFQRGLLYLEKLDSLPAKQQHIVNNIVESLTNAGE